MSNKFNYFRLIGISAVIILFGYLFASPVFGACIGGAAVWGTGDDKASCLQKKKLKKEEQQLKIQKKERELELERQSLQNNQGPGAGTGNTNVILGGLDMLMNGDQQENETAGEVVFSQHQVRIELMPYVVPGAYQFDDPGTPEQIFFNGAAWEYFLNRNLGFGLSWQRWSKAGGKDFDPVIAAQRDGSGDTAVFFPGAIDRLQYTSYVLYATINAELAPSWMSVLRLGIGQTKVDVEYSDINAAANPYARQPADNTYTDSASLMAGLAIEYIALTGTRIGGEIRYHNARYDTSDYTEYMNLGSTQIVFYMQFMLEPLGLL